MCFYIMQHTGCLTLRHCFLLCTCPQLHHCNPCLCAARTTPAFVPLCCCLCAARTFASAASSTPPGVGASSRCGHGTCWCLLIPTAGRLRARSSRHWRQRASICGPAKIKPTHTGSSRRSRGCSKQLLGSTCALLRTVLACRLIQRAYIAGVGLLSNNEGSM